jgi:ribonuclease T1
VNRRAKTRLVAGFMALVLVVPLVAGLLAAGSGTGGSSQDAVETLPTFTPLPRVSDLPAVGLEELPREALETLQLIGANGPFPFDRDGATFQNREGILPEQPDGYYREFTVPTPGSDDRGARRFVVGQNDEIFYTEDHYETFRELVLG